MNKKGLTAAGLLGVLALSVAALQAPAGAPSTYKVGDKIADFAFKDDYGKTMSLSQFKGKVVVLNFFASW